jgi:hypothetical protein
VSGRFPERRYRDVIEIVPPGKIRTTEVRHALVTRLDSDRSFVFEGADAVLPGRYCQLLVDGALFMTDTPAERRTNRPVVEAARGDVLIGGLGLGLILPPLILAPEVTSITVLEKSPEVIALVAPSYQIGAPYWANTVDAYRLHKLRFIEADVFQWTPDQKFHTVWFDIWPAIELSNLPEMAKLHRHYRPHLQPDDQAPWLRCWCESELRTHANIKKIKEALW